MKLNINLLDNMKRRAVINSTPEPRVREVNPEPTEADFGNPYVEPLRKVSAGELDPLAPTARQKAKEESIKKAKQAVVGMAANSANRKAFEALMPVIEDSI